MKHRDTFLTLPVTYCATDDELPSVAITSGDMPVTWQEFHTVRNAIVRSLRPFGTVGPMGEAPITSGQEGPPDSWDVETDDPRYFVVDDQYNDTSRYHYVEVQHPEALSLPVLRSLWETISTHPTWSIGIGIPQERYIYLQFTHIWTRGAVFQSCRSLQSLVDISHPERTV